VANNKNRAGHQVLVDYKNVRSAVAYQDTPRSKITSSPPTTSGNGYGNGNGNGNGRIRIALAIGAISLASGLIINHVFSNQPAETEVASAEAIAVPTSGKLAIAKPDAEAPVEKPQPQFFFNANTSGTPSDLHGEVPFLEVDTIDDFLPEHETPSHTSLISLIPITAAAPTHANDYNQEPSKILIEVQPGDTLSGLLAVHDLSSVEIAEITSLQEVKDHLVNIRPGQEMQINLDGSRRLTHITRNIDLTKTLLVSRKPDNRFSATLNVVPLEKTIQVSELTMDSSLFNDGAKAGLSESLIMDLYSIFQWTVDFNREVRAGDRLTVLHETFSKDGKKVKDGNILAAEYHSSQDIHTAFRHMSDGTPGYYDAKGQSLKKQFLRNPIKARITSRFNLKRKHPIRHTIRAHKGVDYGAPTGTPISAAGDGRIVFAGKRGSYGNTIEIQHGDHHTTLYAHLSKFAKSIKKGTRVSQGETIGFVGSTGLATGPHLHYEFRVNGKHQDPQKVELGGSVPLKPEALAGFKDKIAPLRARLAAANETSDTLAMR